MNEMENRLSKIIEKAVKGGYKALKFGGREEYIAELLIGAGYGINGLLLSHDFLKAYYGEEDCCQHCGAQKGDVCCPEFIGSVPHYLYQAGVLARSTDRIEYLGRSL